MYLHYFHILLIFYKQKSQKSNLSLYNKNLKWGKYHYEINVFLKYMLDTIIDNYYFQKDQKGLTRQIYFHSLLWSYLPRVPIFLAMIVGKMYGTVYIYI